MKPLRARKKTVTIEGILVPVVWSTSGNPTVLAIAAFDENDYWLNHEDAVARWCAHIGRRVIARGQCVDKGHKLWLALDSIDVV